MLKKIVIARSVNHLNESKFDLLEFAFNNIKEKKI